MHHSSLIRFQLVRYVTKSVNLFARYCLGYLTNQSWNTRSKHRASQICRTEEWEAFALFNPNGGPSERLWRKLNTWTAMELWSALLSTLIRRANFLRWTSGK